MCVLDYVKAAHPDIIHNIIPGRVELSIEKLERLGFYESKYDDGVFTFADLDREDHLKKEVKDELAQIYPKEQDDEFLEHDV